MPDKTSAGPFNQALQRSLAPRPIPFPHAARVRDALGTSAPLHGVHDPQGCAARGALAFTTGTVSHFAEPHPNLHVATHEAVHQLQHAGVTHDAGLGAEGHASIAADAAWTGRSAAWLMGPRGARVSSAERHYVFYGQLGRLGEHGETLTFSSHQAFATPSLIASAGGNLAARRSGISLTAGSATRSVEAPDGSGTKTLSEVSATSPEIDPKGDKFFSDCRQAAQEVMGGKGLDGPEAAAIAPGGTLTLVDAPENVADYVALVFFVEDRIRKNPAYPTLSDADKRAFVDKARSDFEWLDKEEKAALRKQAVTSSKAKELGIDQSAEPRVGEAFAVFPAERPGIGQFKFHFATVIMVAGPDRVTLENSGGARDEKTASWKIETYGPADKGQSFHDAWTGFGPDRHTLVVRNQPLPPAYAADLPTKSTLDLIALYAKGTADERYYLKQELDKRQITGTVEVVKQEDWTGDDEVFLQFSAGPRSARTSTVRIPQGTTRLLALPVGSLVPVDDPLRVSAYEYDLLDPNDLIGTVAWASPYAPVTITLTGHGARYVVTLNL